MTHGGEIIRKLLMIKKAERLLETEKDRERRERVSELIMELERDIPPLVLAHIVRLEAMERPGFSEVKDGKCASCGTEVPADEYEYLRRENIGVCDKCFAFLYVPNPELEDDGGLFESLEGGGTVSD